LQLLIIINSQCNLTNVGISNSQGVIAKNEFEPSTSDDWVNWGNEQERNTLAAWRIKPALMIADFRREQDAVRDYEGREILELLQNANDAAQENNQQGKVSIFLSEDGLVVANTGKPFSSDGIISLQNDHLSPKRHSKGNLIGDKGLGFRAILNWSRTPIIRDSPDEIASGL